MGRPKKILPDEICRAVCTDLDFAKTMLHTTKLKVSDIEAVLRHLDMARDDLAQLIALAKLRKKR